MIRLNFTLLALLPFIFFIGCGSSDSKGSSNNNGNSGSIKQDISQTLATNLRAHVLYEYDSGNPEILSLEFSYPEEKLAAVNKFRANIQKSTGENITLESEDNSIPVEFNDDIPTGSVRITVNAIGNDGSVSITSVETNIDI